MSRVQQPVEVREVLYILDPPKPPTNGWGTTGFVFSILGIFTGGFLSPLGLLFSFFGLWKRPRRFAMIGFLLSLLGVGFISTLVSLPFIAHERQRTRAREYHRSQQTLEAMEEATSAINQETRNVKTQLDGFAGNQVTIRFQDAWGVELRFDERENGYAIRSAGPDRKFNSRDDLIREGEWMGNLVPANTTQGIQPLELETDSQ